MEKNVTYVIVGGVAGGMAAATRLRRLDERAEIVVFEKGEYVSFSSCGLPYYVGGEIRDVSSLILQTPETLRSRYNLDVRIKSRVVSIDRLEKTVTVKNLATQESYKQPYDKLLLSPGAAPIAPDAAGENTGRLFTVNDVRDAASIRKFMEERKPQTAVVVGGGYIGVEMAENLTNAGVEVTLLEMSDQVIAPIDYDMACTLHAHLEEKGVRLECGRRVTAVRQTAQAIEVKTDEDSVIADFAVMGIGVRPESGLAKLAGLEVNKRGSVIVSDTMQTSDPDIYAVGDAVQVKSTVTGREAFLPLAGPAVRQARVAADNLCGKGGRYEGAQGSAILRVFDMTVAVTGMNEKTAKELDIEYGKTYLYPQNHTGAYPGAVNMMTKVLYDKQTGRILGAQIVGYEGVDKRCDVFAVAIAMGATAADIAKMDLCYAPPYSSAKDPVNVAGEIIENVLAGLNGEYYWHDVAGLPRDGSVQLVDIRTALEYRGGHIDGYTNIPLDELRGRLAELDKSKKVYVMCHSGMRGYLGVRILRQNGFDAYNLSGGYVLYLSVVGKQEATKPTETMPRAEAAWTEAASKTVSVDASGLQCPGPMMKLAAVMKNLDEGQLAEIKATDPAFETDLEGYARSTGDKIENIHKEGGVIKATVRKGGGQPLMGGAGGQHNKNMIIFSDDLDRAIASFVIANAAAAMGRKVSMFFTFWGLGVIRKPNMNVAKSGVAKMFDKLLPKGTQKLKLSKYNMGGRGAKMMRDIMRGKNIASLETLIKAAQQNGVEFLACSMSMDVMGIKKEELLDGVKVVGATAMLANAEESDMSLFI